MLDPLCVKEVKQTQNVHHSADIINSVLQMEKKINKNKIDKTNQKQVTKEQVIHNKTS